MDLAATVTALALVMAGAVLLSVLVKRLNPDPALWRVIAASYGLRVILTFALFSISFWHLSVLRAFQSGEGFWVFGLDSQMYHLYGAGIAKAWEQGVELPDPQLGIAYFFVVALLYTLFGPHPLYPALLNAWLVSLTAVLGYLIGRRLFSHKAGVLSAVLVGFWPSSLLWSTQLLKDSLAWFLCMSTLWLMLAVIPHRDERRPIETKRWMGWCAILWGVVSALTCLRAYMGSLVSMAAMSVFVPAAVSASLHKRGRDSVRYWSLVFMVVSSVLITRTWDLFRWVSPRHPEVAHFHWAIRYAQQGQMARANEEFSRATQLHDAYTDAYRGLAVTFIRLGNVEAQNGRPDQAGHFYMDAVKTGRLLLEREQDLGRRALIREAIGRLYFEVAVYRWRGHRVDDSADAYDNARTFYPGVVEEFGDLSPHINGPLPIEFAERPSLAPLPGGGMIQQEMASSPDLFVSASARVEALSVVADALFPLIAPPASDAPVLLPEGRKKEQQQQQQQQETTIPPSRLAPFLTLEEEQGERTISPTRLEAIPTPFRRGLPRGYPTHPRRAGLSPSSAAVGGGPGPASPLNPRGFWDELLVPAPARLEALSVVADALFPLIAPPATTAATTASDAPPVDRRQPPGLERLVWQLPVVESLSRLDDEAFLAAGEMTSESLGARRQGFVDSGGYSLMDAWAKISTPKGLIAYLPRALVIGFLAPFPTQWFDTKGSTGFMRTLAGADTVLIYLLIPALLIGIQDVVRRRRADGLLLLVFVLIVAMPMSLVVANLGSLYRLRLQFVLPMLIIAAGGMGHLLRFASMVMPRGGLARPPMPTPTQGVVAIPSVHAEDDVPTGVS